MKVISTGNTYRIYDETLRTYDNLPAKTYKVFFSPQTGFFLEETSNLEVNEKIYGVHESKVDKVLKNFTSFNRNLGVILSGDKGIGKSISAKLLGKKAISLGIPVILCNENYPGIADFLGSIEQEVVIIFDEFDKTFAIGGDNGRDNDRIDSHSPEQSGAQTSLLTLFDGLYPGKKLFVITCNDLHNLSEFLVNRPGRFHYHLRFKYPTSDEIREYLSDKVDKKYHDQIEEVVKFACQVDMNYDSLRAIAFELNQGEKFADAIRDLNIINMDDLIRYDILVYLKDGNIITIRNEFIDVYSDEEYSYYHSDRNSDEEYSFNFDFSKKEFDYKTGAIVINGKDIGGYVLTFQNDERERSPISEHVDHVEFKRKYNRDYHFMV